MVRIPVKKIQNLYSERLVLTELCNEDLHDLHALHSMPEVDEFNTLGIPEDLSDTRHFIKTILEDQRSAERRYVCWSVREKTGNDFMGIAGLVFFADRFRMAEIYFKLSPVYWGKGFATELAGRILLFAFRDLRLHRVEAGVATGNTRSIRVLEKLGMRLEGKHRKILPIRGEWKDNYRYAILEEDFRDGELLKD